MDHKKELKEQEEEVNTQEEIGKQEEEEEQKKQEVEKDENAQHPKDKQIQNELIIKPQHQKLQEPQVEEQIIVKEKVQEVEQDKKYQQTLDKQTPTQFNLSVEPEQPQNSQKEEHKEVQVISEEVQKTNKQQEFTDKQPPLQQTPFQVQSDKPQPKIVEEQQSTQILHQTEQQQTSEQPISNIEATAEQPPQILEKPMIQNTCIDNTNVTLVSYFNRKTQIPGRLKITNLRMLFYFPHKTQEQLLLDIPIALLLKAERSVQDKITFCLQIILKYQTSFRIRYLQNQICSKTQRIVTHLIDTSSQLPYQYGTRTPLNLKCQLFCPTRCEEVKQAYWYDNQGWKKLINYPQKFRVPLPYLSKAGNQERLVVLSFTYNNSKDEVSIYRTGPGRPDQSEQQWMGKGKSNPNIITIQIKNKGIGSVRSQATRVVELQNLSQLRQSFTNIYKLAINSHQSSKWVSQLMNTKWYEQIGTLLQQASLLANQVISNSAVVTVLADNDVRAAQVVAICQVLLFPQCRTIKGFGELLERQFLQWGGQRLLLKKQIQPDRGPALIQFLDSIFQLISIYPLSFQFSQSLLIFLADSIYSNHFGNFLLFSKSIKEQQRQSILKCPCIWKTIQSRLKTPTWTYHYLNPFYVDYRQCDIYQLKQIPSMKQLKVWGGFFFKKFRQNNPQYKVFMRYRELYFQHSRNKQQVDALKRQLLVDHKTIQERRTHLSNIKQQI